MKILYSIVGPDGRSPWLGPHTDGCWYFINCIHQELGFPGDKYAVEKVRGMIDEARECGSAEWLAESGCAYRVSATTDEA